MKSLSEISFSPVPIGKQLHLNKWLDKTACPQAVVVSLSESMISCVAVRKQLFSSHTLAETRHKKWLAINASGRVSKSIATIIFVFKILLYFGNFFNFILHVNRTSGSS
jgi:hypothetical protein